MTGSSTTAERRRRFDALVGGCLDDMYRYAAWLSRDRTVAEDVVQEALLRAWRSLDSLKDDSAAKHWLMTIVRRENARWFERRRVTALDVDDLTPAQEALIAREPDDGISDVRAALLALEDDYREPLVLQVLLGHSTSEIAELMGLRQGAVLTRLHRARHKLRALLQEDGAGTAFGMKRTGLTRE